MSIPSPAVLETLRNIRLAESAGILHPSAEIPLKRWLLQPEYAEFVPEIIAHVERKAWDTLSEVFHTSIPFGTAGRRGRMYPIGTNAINERTVGETIQGLADFILEERGDSDGVSCAVGYDTRHNSRLFAELAAEILAAAGFVVWFLDGPRPTPELAYTVRRHACQCGVMISASHNPPTDNAVKVFWKNGGQILPFEADGIMHCGLAVTEVDRILFDEAVPTGAIELCQREMDDAYVGAVLENQGVGPRDLKILYSPLHGVGTTSVIPVLAGAGFTGVTVFPPHAEQDGSFPNVPYHTPNPEQPAVFADMIRSAQESETDLILATDPDADRLGVAARLTPEREYESLSGNQIGVLLAEFVLRRGSERGELTPQHFLVKTLVTTNMLRRIADAYHVRTCGNVLTGFKWIAEVIDREGPDRFLFAAEEAHGYLAGTHIRDKDGAVAALLTAELAAEQKAQGRTLHQQLDRLFEKYGCHAERTVALEIAGVNGRTQIARLLDQLRKKPPRTIGGMSVGAVRDYLHNQLRLTGGIAEPLDGPRTNLLFFDLEGGGGSVAVRPSGTEPKLKLYYFAYEPPSTEPIDVTKQRLESRLDAMAADFATLIECAEAEPTP